MTLPTRRMMNLVYHWGVRNASEDQRAEVDAMLTAAATGMDVTATPAAATADAPGQHVPGTAPSWIKPPSWWKGDRAAFDNTVSAAQQLGEPAAKGLPTRARPMVGSRG